jgi:pantothenate kinase type III
LEKARLTRADKAALKLEEKTRLTEEKTANARAKLKKQIDRKVKKTLKQEREQQEAELSSVEEEEESSREVVVKRKTKAKPKPKPKPKKKAKVTYESSGTYASSSEEEAPAHQQYREPTRDEKLQYLRHMGF